MKERKVTQKQAMQIASWERFLEVHQGCYPAQIAAAKLRMSPQGVYQASERGWIAFFSVGRNRWYSKRDVIRYRWEASKQYRDNRPLPPYKHPKNYAETS